MPAGVPVQVRLSDGELSALDSYRREKLNSPSRGRALRELARMGLQGSETLRHSIAISEREVGTCSK
jgi:hypothetical protein